MRGGEENALPRVLSASDSAQSLRSGSSRRTFAALIWGSRANATSRRPMERKRRRWSGPATRRLVRDKQGRFACAVRRRRGTSASSRLRVGAAQPVRDRSGSALEREHDSPSERGFKAVAQRRRVAKLFDPAAAHDQVARIEHRALARRDGALRFVETHFDAAVREQDRASPAQARAGCESAPRPRRSAQSRARKAS